MKKYTYWTKNGKFEVHNYRDIPFDNLHSPNEKTPALIYPYSSRSWWRNGEKHRLIGPAVIWFNGREEFWLNGNRYYNFEEWLENHPNQDETFQTKMKLQYT